ncbi:MAG: hypothetical protein ACW981_18900 [Candidatus Hodarchaeales archaeon]|jgi:hypothetical protein
MQDSVYLSMIPALGAIALSLYNWYSLRQGGRVKPLRIVNYGLWSVNADQRKIKHLFMPVILDNMAIKSGLVTDIAISFIRNGEEIPLRVDRHIVLDMPSGSMSGMGINSFRINQTKEIVPFYPITVPGQEGKMVMLDCIDSGKAIELDKESKCRIEVIYGNNKKSAVIFPFKISSEEYDKALDHIKWYKLSN